MFECHWFFKFTLKVFNEISKPLFGWFFCEVRCGFCDRKDSVRPFFNTLLLKERDGDVGGEMRSLLLEMFKEIGYIISTRFITAKCWELKG